MKWEYKTINIMPPLRKSLTTKGIENDIRPLIEEELCVAGKEGWELVSVVGYDMDTKYFLFLKRPKEE